MPPRVSVLFPCRNARATLDDALDSLAAQTCDAYEIIAVDDGSIDGTGARLAARARRDARLRVLHQPARGLVPALTAAATVARGELLARMDADDLAAPDRLARQVAWLDAHPDAAACGTQIRYFPRRLVRDGARRYERWINDVLTPEDMDRHLFVECPIPHPTLMMRRTAYDGAGGYREAGWPEDYDLLLRLVADGWRLGKVPEVLLDWREGPDRLSRTDPRYAEAAFRRLKAAFLPRLRLAGRDVLVWGAGPVGKAFARALQQEGQTVVAFVELDPRKLGQTIHGAPVIPPARIGEVRGAYALAAVGAADARAQIRAALEAAGWREIADWCAVA